MKKHLPPVREGLFWHSPIMIGVAILAFVGVTIGALRLLTKERSFVEQVHARTVVRDQLEETHQELLDDVAFIESERGQDEAIRRQFDVVREGESLVIIPEVHEKKAPLPASLPDTVIETSIWEKLMFWK